STAGFLSDALFGRATKTGVIVLRNVTGGKLKPADLALRVLEKVAAAPRKADGLTAPNYNDVMRGRLIGICSLGGVLLVMIAAHPTAQSRPLVVPAAAAIYQRLLPQIERIKIFDHHAHPAFPGDADVD